MDTWVLTILAIAILAVGVMLGWLLHLDRPESDPNHPSSHYSGGQKN